MLQWVNVLHCAALGYSVAAALQHVTSYPRHSLRMTTTVQHVATECNLSHDYSVTHSVRMGSESYEWVRSARCAVQRSVCVISIEIGDLARLIRSHQPWEASPLDESTRSTAPAY